MAKKLSSALGIDIGSKTIKVAEVRNQGRQPVVTALGAIETPADSVDHTGVFNADNVGAALKQLLASIGASSPNVVVSIAGQASVLVRTLEVPRMNDTELAEHMQWEISRNIPFAESTVQSAYAKLDDQDPNAANMDVVLAISPQSAVDTLISAIKKAGKQLAAIDVEPTAVARMLAISGVNPTEVSCVVDIGHKTTGINIYRGRNLLMPRQVPVGGELFSQELARNLNVSAAEAEEILRTRAEIPRGYVAEAPPDPFSVPGSMAGEPLQPYNPFAPEPEPSAFEPDAGATGGFEPAPEHSAAPEPLGNPETMRILDGFRPALEELVAEIRRSLDYFRSKGGEVDRLRLFGGVAKLKGLPEYLGSSLGLGCELLDPFQGLTVNARKADPELLDGRRGEFVVAIGNGLYILF
ncbi:MAG: type IV pilus assembly protein PilM [Fimbriimonadales bacterium]